MTRSTDKELTARGSKLAPKRRSRSDVTPAARRVTVKRVGDLWKIIELIPGYQPRRNAGAYEFYPAIAKARIQWFNKRLVHVRGRTGGQPFVLEPWQQAVIANLFGWRHRKTGLRRYQDCYWTVARKNGKTTTAAGLALSVLTADDLEPGSEIYSAASNRPQAKLVWDQAKGMVGKDPELWGKLDLYHSAMVRKDDPLTTYQSISAEATSAHGYNPQFVVLDELHTQPKRDLYEALKSGMGNRAEPILLSITTAGYDQESICYEIYERAKNIRDGGVDDPNFLPAIWEVGPDDDWEDRTVWAKANPNLGVSVRPEFLEREFKLARQQPRFENMFKRLYLNMWTEQLDRWITQAMWERNGGEVPESAYIGKPCWGGLDLSMSRDLSAFVLVWKLDNVNYVCKAWHFLPMGECQNLHDRGAVDHVNYEPWVRQGFVEVMESFSTDYAVIRRRILDCCKRYRVQDIGYDRYKAADLVRKLEDGDGLAMVDVGTGTKSMSAPSKEFDRLLGDGHFKHQDNPVLRWMAQNVVLDIQDGDLIKPSKDKTVTRIDGIVAAIIALARSLGGKAPAGPAAAPVFIR